MVLNFLYSVSPAMHNIKKHSLNMLLFVFVIFLFVAAFAVVLYSVTKDVEIIWPSTAYWKNRKTKDNVLSSFSILKVEPFFGKKLVHLDLKGAPPSVSYLKKFFAYVKPLGVDGILIEYEDKFPFVEELEDIKAVNAYTLEDVKQILAAAKANDLVLIPLVQTFGHLEFVLKLKKYKDFREVENFPQIVCPSHENITVFIEKMINQILRIHSNSPYVHIGGDEVFFLGKCDRCRNAMKKNNWLSDHLYLNHIKTISMFINKTYPDIRPIIWGDRIIKFKVELVKEFQLPNLVDVMLWNYNTDVLKEAENFFRVYGKIFKSLWIASAFKGATGFDRYVTDARHHLQNQVSWLGVITKWKKEINFKGIALTGWQRYDHFTPLCELLPVAIPSLTVDLLYLQDPIEGINQRQVLNTLQCNSPIAFFPGDSNYVSISQCNFPGFKIYHLMNDFYHRISQKRFPQDRIKRTDLNVYNVLNQFASPYLLSFIFKLWPANNILAEIKVLRENITKALSEVYDEYTVDEWIATHVIPVQLKTVAIVKVAKTLLERQDWPKRPFAINMSEALENMASKVCTPDVNDSCPLFFL